MTNKFMYADIRSFFAACEQYLNPEYRGRPVVVYNESASGRQMIIAASKEAKERYGKNSHKNIQTPVGISDKVRD